MKRKNPPANIYFVMIIILALVVVLLFPRGAPAGMLASGILNQELSAGLCGNPFEYSKCVQGCVDDFNKECPGFYVDVVECTKSCVSNGGNRKACSSVCFIAWVDATGEDKAIKCIADLQACIDGCKKNHCPGQSMNIR